MKEWDEWNSTGSNTSTCLTIPVFFHQVYGKLYIAAYLKNEMNLCITLGFVLHYSDALNDIDAQIVMKASLYSKNLFKPFLGFSLYCSEMF